MKKNDYADLEKKLSQYRTSMYIEKDADKIKAIAAMSKQAYCETAQHRTISQFEFIYEQICYIRKRWWLVQIIILLTVWQFINLTGDAGVVRRYTGAAASLFAIMILPELWKNRHNRSIEIEACAYYSLRQIYAVRIVVFAAVDSLLLGIFACAVSFKADIMPVQFAVDFLLPMTVTASICMRTLCSRAISSEYIAVMISIFWTAIWCRFILDDEIYNAVTPPIWTGICVFAFLYLIYAIRRAVCECERCNVTDPVL